ncbi:MAG: amino acid adenylation domain-containing protein [Rhodobacter sp.]|nr:amino acid adenylation domain-containing protein [Rhodobacter sp.]
MDTIHLEDRVDPAEPWIGENFTDAIRYHARHLPGKCALSDSRAQLTYAELDRFADRFALHLQTLGCKPGDHVVMLASRRSVLVAAIVGTFRSGCVHVPLDPQMPASRVEYILEDITPAVVITEAELHDTVTGFLPDSASVLLVSDLDKLLAEVLADKTVPDVDLPAFDPEASAYCIYTSGSTGRPKGVIIAHASIAPFFEGSREIYNVRQSSICASFSPLHFDVYLMDMLFPLYEGAELHVHDDAVVPDFMFDLLKAKRVTHLSAWGMMLGLIAQAEEFGPGALPEVKTILSGTDVPDIKTVQRWLHAGTGVRVINAYGPTEVTCASTAQIIEDFEPDRKQLYPIGKPLKHVHAVLVDDNDQPITEKGVYGELLVGGVQVMKSYRNRPEESQARLTVRDGIRFYRTGDICEYLPDGALFYHGRRDNEVNIGGRRVHLNEVQRVVCSVSGVHSAEVVTLDSEFGEKILVAAVLPEAARRADGDALVSPIKTRLTEELQAYMIPRHVVVFEEFPQLSSGKTDRKTLTTMLEKQMSQ